MTRPRSKLTFHKPGTYQICVQGVLSKNWRDYVQGMEIKIEQIGDDEPVTILTGELVDQAAVLGVLNVLYNLRLPLISVDYISAG